MEKLSPPSSCFREPHITFFYKDFGLDGKLKLTN